MADIFWVVLGGAVGSLSRYAVYEWSAKALPLNFPYATLLVNLIGSFIIGFVAMFITDSLNLAQPLRLLIMVGFCGGLTTFSAFSLDNVHLMQTGQYAILALNICTNVVLCVIMVLLGMFIASKI